VDFFSGCGGTSLGFKQAGIEPVVAIDIDRDALETYGRNLPSTTRIQRDIRDVHEDSLAEVLGPLRDRPLIFAACAPCQPFSRQRRGTTADLGQASLIAELVRFVTRWRPSAIFLENVPGLQTRAEGRAQFDGIRASLKSMEYEVRFRTVEARAYGVPQRRRRLVVLASQSGSIDIPVGEFGNGGQGYVTVRDAIEGYPPLPAGGVDESIPNHRAARMSDLNIRRIRATPEGGDHRSWPVSLVNGCHTRNKVAHVDAYGRLAWDAPSGALTTRCISYSNGRFGHPTQDRAISLREAAAIQTFPDSFVFEGTLTSAARQIGNAVPVLLAKRFGEAIVAGLVETGRPA